MTKRALISLILKVSGNVNADIGIGTRIPLKKIITLNQEVKPFVSARCIRRCIREKLYEKGFNVDPLQLIGKGERQQLGDIGDPVTYVDDDLFGYLRPEVVPLKRSSPIKISHLISLRHAEIKVEFAARFQRDFLKEYEKGYPAPFEIELAEWLGKLNVIISDRIGRFTSDEITDEIKKKLKDGNSLQEEERIRRLTAFLEILLWEGWEFPRGAQSPNVPEFYYGVIALTDRFAPIFGYVDINEEGKLNNNLINGLREMYSPLLDGLFVLNYKECKFSSYIKTQDNNIEQIEDQKLDSNSIASIINKICRYVIKGKITEEEKANK
jgi:CRISPR-associated protein Cst2